MEKINIIIHKLIILAEKVIYQYNSYTEENDISKEKLSNYEDTFRAIILYANELQEYMPPKLHLNICQKANEKLTQIRKQKKSIKTLSKILISN